MNQSQRPTGFPATIERLFTPLRHEVAKLHANWDTFKQLYGSQESVDVLNSVAPGAFAQIGCLFKREFIAAACRITDPKATGRGPKAKENLTIAQLLYAVEVDQPDQSFLDRLTAKKQEIDSHCRPVRERRNRIIGHLDLLTAINTHPSPLPAVDSNNIAEFLRLLAEFMNLILGYYRAAHADFVPTVSGSARNIVYGLKKFKQLQKLEYERELAALSAE